MSLLKNLKSQDKVIDLTQRRAERELMREYNKSLKVVQGKVADLFRKYSDADGKLSLADVSKYNRLANLEKDIVKEMGKLSSKQNLTTTKTIKRVYEESFYRTAFVVENEVRRQFESRLAFGLLPDKQVKAAILNPYDRIGWPERSKNGIRTGTRRVKEAVTQGIIQGKGYAQTAREMKGMFDKTASDALRIIQTESHRAREQGRWDSYDEATEQGLILRAFWESALDDATREMHQDMDGREAMEVYDPKQGEEDYLFELPDGIVGYPGNTGEAHHDINCRCTTRVELEGVKPDKRRVRLSDEEYERRLAEADGDKSKVSRSEVVPYKSYHEWANDNGIK